MSEREIEEAEEKMEDESLNGNINFSIFEIKQIMGSGSDIKCIYLRPEVFKSGMCVKDSTWSRMITQEYYRKFTPLSLNSWSGSSLQGTKLLQSKFCRG